MVADRGANGRLQPGGPPDAIEAAAVLVSGYTLLFEPTFNAAATAALQRAAARFVAVDGASWPMIRDFGVDRFFEVTATPTRSCSTIARPRRLTGRRGERAADALADRFRGRLRQAGRGGRGDVVGGARDPSPGASASPSSTRRARATRSTACCSRTSWRDGRPATRCTRRVARGRASPRATRPGPSGRGPMTRSPVRGGAGDASRATPRSSRSRRASSHRGCRSPRNLECVDRMDAAVRAAGAVPAWVGRRRRRGPSSACAGSTRGVRRAGPGVEGRAPRPPVRARRGRTRRHHGLDHDLGGASAPASRSRRPAASAASTRAPATSRRTSPSSRARRSCSSARGRSPSSTRSRRRSGSRSSASRSSATAASGSRSSSPGDADVELDQRVEARRDGGRGSSTRCGGSTHASAVVALQPDPERPRDGRRRGRRGGPRLREAAAERERICGARP